MVKVGDELIKGKRGIVGDPDHCHHGGVPSEMV